MKSFRDPVHNLIAFTSADGRLIDLINSREVQRLRRIRQLGLSNIAYPGAEHSRFVHSLGVAHLVQRFLDAPTRGAYDAPGSDVRDFRHLALAAGLLHDLGHGPFSHALETITGIRHERFTAALIRSPHTEVHQILEGWVSGLSERVAQVVERTFEPSRALVKLLSSQLDMDRTDYLLRDALMTGAGYGSFDVEWLLHVLRIGEADGDLEVGLDLERGMSIAEDYIMSRYYMYLHVYFHRTTRAAEVLVEKVLERAREVKAELPGFTSLNRLLRSELGLAEDALHDYLELDDFVLWTALHFWSRHDDPVLRDLAGRLLHRKVFSGIDVTSDEETDRWRERMAARAHGEGLPEKYYVIVDEAKSSAYKDDYLSGAADSRTPSEKIYLFDRTGAATELSELSFIVQAVRNRHLRVQRILCPGEWLDA